MKNSFHKRELGKMWAILKSRKSSIKLGFVILISLLCLAAFPYFNAQGPGLPVQNHGAISPYLNGAFPNQASIDLKIGHRVAYSNLSFNSPIVFKPVPNENRIILAQINGEIYWFENDETTTTKNLLIDLKDDVGVVHDGGFLGLALHPEFNSATNPQNFAFVYYTSENWNSEDEPRPGTHTGQGCYFSESNNEYQGNSIILERLEIDPVTMSVLAGSRTNLIDIRMYGTTHYGGGIEFGNDGFLYLTIGDQASWRRAQNTTDNLSGGALRIDVDKDPTKSHEPIRKKQDVGYAGESSGIEYWIPNDNPFLSPDGSTYEEYYSIGLRNPFRMTKDRVTGDFYIGDVGLNNHEEVNVLTSGANYGWPLYEGFDLRPNGGTCVNLLNNMPHELPLTEFARNDANALAGGFVYRGVEIPDLYGVYVCADYGGGDEIFSVDITTGAYEQISTLGNVISFGEDYNGELYMLRYGNNQKIYKLIEGVDDGYIPMPQLLSDVGVFSNLSTLEVIDGVIPYELYESFWSDGALKKRWIAVPNNDGGLHTGSGEQVDYDEYSDWEFPPGTVIIKHFELKVDDTDPTVTRKIETRFSIVDQLGDWYFLTYNWNDDQLDAVLQTTSLNEPVSIATDNLGGTRTQTWHFPSNSECGTCHNDANKGSLGLKSRYLNTDYDYSTHDPVNGQIGNQLVTWSHLGLLNQSITDADTEYITTNTAIDDPLASIDEKARSYLDLNCAYCHRLDHNNRTDFDLRVFNSLEATQILNTGILTPLNVAPDEKVIFPGDASKSILYHKMNSVSPSIMMPPLSKLAIDQPAVDLIEAWINQLDNDPTTEDNNPNPMSNLALLPSATVVGSVGSGDPGRGTPEEILYDPMTNGYKMYSQYAEYGWPYNYNAGLVDEANGFFLHVEWPNPKFINYMTIGGAYSSQPQPNTMWRVSYLRAGTWHTLDQGQGGWIDGGIYEWGGATQTPILAEAVKVVLYSDGSNDLFSIHLRGRGGNSGVGDANPNNPYYNDVDTEPKATLFQFVPYDVPTIIDNIVVGAQQSPCNTNDNTYTQELVVTYSNPPTTGFLVVNGQDFPITSSPQTVTLTGLMANGEDVEVEAEFSDGYKTNYYSFQTVFTAPENCVDLIVGVDETLLIDSDYTVPSAGTVEILEGGALTITGNLTINGEVILNSISDKYSSLIVEGTSTGTINYKRHVNAYNGITGNDLIAPPVNNQTFGDFSINNNENLYENPNNTAQKLFGPFDEVAGAYLLYDTSNYATTPLEVGLGYRAARDSSDDALMGTTLSFNGTVETGTVTQNISSTSTGYNGWNLVGNPYPSYLDFDLFFNVNNTQLDSGSYQAVYGYDGDETNGWTVWNLATTGQSMAPGQGFFIKSKSGGGQITFTPAMRTGGNSDDFVLGRDANPHIGFLKLKASTAEAQFHTDFYFNANASSQLDPGYDAALYNGYTPDFSLYSHLVDNSTTLPYMIQTLGEMDLANVTIPLGLHASEGENITISILDQDLPESVSVYLEDSLNNTYTLLNEQDYTFTSETNLSGIGRFYLRFEDGVLHLPEHDLDRIAIFANEAERSISIVGPLEAPTQFILYDIHGRVVSHQSLKTNQFEQSIPVHYLSFGVYIVELKSDKGFKRIKKVVLK